jgi:hypothetical protein
MYTIARYSPRELKILKSFNPDIPVKHLLLMKVPQKQAVKRCKTFNFSAYLARKKASMNQMIV